MSNWSPPPIFNSIKKSHLSMGCFFAFYRAYARGRGWKSVKITIIPFFRCLKMLDANLNWILMREGLKIAKKVMITTGAIGNIFLGTYADLIEFPWILDSHPLTVRYFFNLYNFLYPLSPKIDLILNVFFRYFIEDLISCKAKFKIHIVLNC